jgi:hypothetical protein
MTQRKAIRTNEIYFCSLPWAQVVVGSNPLAPTKELISFFQIHASVPFHTLELISARSRI